jgi:hypothetical protein
MLACTTPRNLGFGMGGQFDYCGLWLNADFSHGHSKAGPLCTTYMSPRLSSQEEFIIDQVEGTYVMSLLIMSSQDPS